jgi:hypothetical protein
MDCPGSPWENGYVATFNGRLRDELLIREACGNLWGEDKQYRKSFTHFSHK